MTLLFYVAFVDVVLCVCLFVCRCVENTLVKVYNIMFKSEQKTYVLNFSIIHLNKTFKKEYVKLITN